MRLQEYQRVDVSENHGSNNASQSHSAVKFRAELVWRRLTLPRASAAHLLKSTLTSSSPRDMQLDSIDLRLAFTLYLRGSGPTHAGFLDYDRDYNPGLVASFLRGIWPSRRANENERQRIDLAYVCAETLC